jgi:HAD superfamily hydrolase (TIGR01509 family)
MTVQAIIFDCDGTLVDSEGLASQVLVDCLGELGHLVSVEDAIASYTGMKMADCIADIERRFARKLPDEFVPTFRARMATSFGERLRPIEGARELLESLDLPVHIASSGPREKIRSSLRASGLEAFFEQESSIFSAYEIGTWKPAPAFYEAVISSLGLRPAEAIVVEDSLPGIRSAVGAGISTIALGAGERLTGELTVALPASSLAEVGWIIRELRTRSVRTTGRGDDQLI